MPKLPKVIWGRNTQMCTKVHINWTKKVGKISLLLCSSLENPTNRLHPSPQFEKYIGDLITAFLFYENLRIV